jgi:hypothetical protein
MQKTEPSRESSSFWADDLMTTEQLSTRLATLQAAAAVLLVRNAFLLAAGFGNKAVPEIFPNGPVRPQVDRHGHALALVVGNELNPSHSGLSSWHMFIISQE